MFMVLIYRASVGTTGRCVFAKFRGRCAVLCNRKHSGPVADCKRLHKPCLLWSHGIKLKNQKLAGICEALLLARML